ncbi:putative glycosyl transferase, family 17 [Helianthus anomalus]
MIDYEIRCDTTMSMHTLKVLVKECSAEVKIVSSLTVWYNAIRLCNNREERLHVYNLIESKVQDDGNYQVSGRHDFSHGTRFKSGRILALDGFQLVFFCFVGVGYFRFRLRFFVSFWFLFSFDFFIFLFRFGRFQLFWKRTRPDSKPVLTRTNPDPDLLKKFKSFSFLKLESNKFPIFHLNLNNYLHSFEFNVDHRSWRASIPQYQKGKTRYAHYRQTDYLLAESGWHCSF